MTTATVTLTGAALKAEATRLVIPGRSKMTADQLREAVTTVRAALDAQDVAYRESFDDTAEAADESTDDSVSGWAGDMADRSLSERHSTPVPDQRPNRQRDEASGLPAPITPTAFAARWGKRKPSTHGRTHRRTGR